MAKKKASRTKAPKADTPDQLPEVPEVPVPDAAGGDGTPPEAGKKKRSPRNEIKAEPIDLKGATKLVIVESPAKAKTINKYLGKDYRVVASMGHVRDLPRNRFGIDIEHDFAPHYVEITRKKKHTRELRKAAKAVDEVYLCPDPDREGEAIAWHLIAALKIPPGKSKRATFSEITQRAVKEAFAHTREVNENLVNAQQARRILDRLVGYKLSPLLWKKIIKRLSAGRVQSVAARLICEREDEIDRFVAEEYWRVIAKLSSRGNGRSVSFETELRGRRRNRKDVETCPACGGEVKEMMTPRGKVLRCVRSEECDGSLQVVESGGGAAMVVEPVRLTNEAQAQAVLAELEGREFSVADVVKRDSVARPYPPFSTSTMQQAAATRLNFTTKKTMMLSQRLYEGVEMGSLGSVGLITYMRTDSFHLAPEAIDQARKYIAAKHGDEYVPEQPNVYKARKGAQEAHEAIRPTQVSITPDSAAQYLEPDMLKLYRLIWQRFLACQMAPARYEDTSATLLAGDLVFPAHGRVMLFPGCTLVYGPATKGKKNDAGPKALPPLEVGQTLQPRSVEKSQHFTQPPSRYTEASLVKTLEAEGIGRPSTYAAIISTIQDRGYVRKEGGSFRATELGRIVNDRLVKHFPSIIDVHFTAEMEGRLDKVEDGSQDWVQLLKDFYGPFLRDLETADREMVAEVDQLAPGGEKCLVCGEPMVIKLSRKGRFLGCSKFPECRFSQPLGPDGKAIELPEAAIGKRCPNCGGIMVLRVSRRGQFLACTEFPKCRTTIPIDEAGKAVELEKTDEVCEKCGTPMQVRLGRWGKFLSCSAYPKCRNARPLPGALPGEPAPGAAPCEKCGSPMVLRRTKRGGYLLCSKYPDCKQRRTTEELGAIVPGAAASEGEGEGQSESGAEGEEASGEDAPE
jgi:DNA topoisomerase-1